MGSSQRRRLEEQIALEIGLAVLLLGGALIQSALLPRPLGFAPNLMLMLVVCKTVLSGPALAARWAFYGGLSLDLCADMILGSHALALLAAVLVASLTLGRLSRTNWLLPLTGTLVGALAYYTAYAGIMLLLIGRFELERYFFVVMLPSVLVALIPSLPLFLIMRRFMAWRRGEVPLDVY